MATQRKRGIVRLFDSQTEQSDLALGKDLILENDISLGISNDFQPLLSGNVGGVMSFLSSLSGGAVSAGFRQQGFQIWRGTSPIELKLSVSLHMVTSGRLDVVKPAENLMAYSVPDLNENGWGLTPPGASVLAILGEETAQDLGDNYNVSSGKGWVSVTVGSYIQLDKCIIKNVIPTYSLQEDSEGYPISCKLDIDISTLDIANSAMINKLSITGGTV